MAYTAPVVDGEITGANASSNSLSSTKKDSNSALDKDAFLNLLVAQMKYQDPLEPTSNTEYISQLATFSELEEMQNLGSGMDIQRASGLVGKEVIMEVVSDTTGETEYVRGKVDYVQMEGNKVLLSIGNALYSLSDLDSVVDESYIEAYDKAAEVAMKLDKIPALNSLDKDDTDKVNEVWKLVDEMSDYEKSFISKDMQELISAMKAKIDELNGKDEESEGTDEEVEGEV